MSTTEITERPILMPHELKTRTPYFADVVSAAPTFNLASTERPFHEFLSVKTQSNTLSGFAPTFMPDYLFDFQACITDLAIRTGRYAIFADCGLGKTLMELVWAENVVRHTRLPVLLSAPLAVSHQILREAERFDIRATRSIDGTAHPGITVTNYERLHLFNPSHFAGFVGDESSILKSFNGARRKEITIFMRHLPYRLLPTATAAPNDYTELGTTSEALGYLGHMDMLSRFFKNAKNNSFDGRANGESMIWRFKGHAEHNFWRFVCSFSRSIRKPSDLGFDDGDFILPELIENEHLIEADWIPDGSLFPLNAVGLREQRDQKKATVQQRCEKVAELVNNTGKPALVWCHLNEEGNALERLIPDAVQVKGQGMTDDEKEARMLDFVDGNARVLITKPKIGAWGLNFQHCAHVVDFPSHSYEQRYQGIRRCWRFGQKNRVVVDTVTTEGDADVLANMRRKAAQADRMFANLVAAMNESLSIDRSISFPLKERVPSWLS